ncbi:glutamate-1-semialdehyde 2,1-aminomutase [Tepidiforma sp.]|uniref:glutamate-1-semialdehyde 2,1-aminomutase n=1 Tax=Tepidiforma sp. TaxID=2682230 RepID=UPI002ADE2991|nr:glutamate-1-semialdehyde 2,1-aminomutase [Tepidiforma sp.]
MTNQTIRSAAADLFPGGVNSPVRSYRSVGGDPIPIARGEGPYVYDAEGTRYIDYVGGFGPAILGHAHPAVTTAIAEAAASGLAFGALGPREIELAAAIRDATGLERLRFLNSGTEATMTAIRIARAATQRDLIVKFDGCYHGHSDGLLVRAGSGVATLGLSDSAGVPQAVAGLTAVLPYNDPAALIRWFEAHPGQTAAVIVESIPANVGLLAPDPEFLQTLQSLTRADGALLIADEIITGFRLRRGLSGVLPHAQLVTLGKIIGGGLPIGAIGGPAPLLGLLAPEGPVYQAGTFSANPAVMAAGAATLDQLTPAAYERLEQVARHLENGLLTAIRRAEAPASVARFGSMLSLFFRPTPPRDYAEARQSDTAAFARFHRAMRQRGILIPPSQFETWFVSLAHNEPQIDATVQAAAQALREAIPA